MADRGPTLPTSWARQAIGAGCESEADVSWGSFAAVKAGFVGFGTGVPSDEELHAVIADAVPRLTNMLPVLADGGTGPPCSASLHLPIHLVMRLRPTANRFKREVALFVAVEASALVHNCVGAAATASAQNNVCLSDMVVGMSVEHEFCGRAVPLCPARLPSWAQKVPPRNDPQALPPRPHAGEALGAASLHQTDHHITRTRGGSCLG